MEDFAKNCEKKALKSPHAKNVAATSRNPFYFSLQRKFPLLDFVW